MAARTGGRAASSLSRWASWPSWRCTPARPPTAAAGASPSSTRPTRSSRPGSGTPSGVRTVGTTPSSWRPRRAMWSAWACRRRASWPAHASPPPPPPGLVVWAGLGVAWIVGIALAARRSRASLGLTPTDSLVERFGLFTIIVLGEVVLGVVDGLSVAERDAKTIITGMLALSLGFGFWWIYFDLVGSRLPRANRVALANWVMSHLPITLAITAAGAGMVSLIGHAHDARTPAGTSWLLAGAVATGLVALVLTERALVDAERLFSVFHPLGLALSGGAAAALIVGWARPAPWLLALALAGGGVL